MRKELIELEVLPIRSVTLPVYVNDRKFCFLLDTGASQTILAEHLVGDLSLEHIRATDQVISAGKDLFEVSFVCDVRLQIGGWKYTAAMMAYILLDHLNAQLETYDVQVDGILGMDFLVQLKSLIDLSESRLQIEY